MSALQYARAPLGLPRVVRCGDASRVPTEQVVRVTSREPCSLLMSLSMPPQHVLTRRDAAGSSSQGIVLLCGPPASDDCLRLARRLAGDMPDRLSPVARLTTTTDGNSSEGNEFLEFVSSRQLAALRQTGGLLFEDNANEEGTPLRALESVWSSGRYALMIGPLSVAEALKSLAGTKVWKM